MTHRPIVLSPATPSELVDHVLASLAYPTTMLVCWPKTQFLEGLVQDVRGHLEHQARPQQPVSRDGRDDQPPSHALLRAPLMQTAVSRHIAMAFIPSVTHLRCYLAAFFARDSKTAPPPVDVAPASSATVPMLLVYGFLELHRDGSEWSAQGLNASAAAFVEAAARNGMRAAVVEPRKSDGPDELGALLAEAVPVLSGSKMRDDGTWSGRLVPVQRVLGRWFEVEAAGGGHWFQIEGAGGDGEDATGGEARPANS